VGADEGADVLIEPNKSCPMPVDPVLTEWAAALRDAGDSGRFYELIP